ncbi:hypothetical protein BHQ15_07265 [Mycolicibacillus koreensis]|nr:hypothetical protein BHQ15_07265 [Mycolicibacillus koreensis]
MGTWDDVARLMEALPLTAEHRPHEWRVGGKLVAWQRPLRLPERRALQVSGDPDVLAVRVRGESAAAALIAAHPQRYFTTAHLAGYPVVLVWLADIDRGSLADLVFDAWLVHAPRAVAREYLARRA